MAILELDYMQTPPQVDKTADQEEIGEQLTAENAFWKGCIFDQLSDYPVALAFVRAVHDLTKRDSRRFYTSDRVLSILQLTGSSSLLHSIFLLQSRVELSPKDKGLRTVKRRITEVLIFRDASQRTLDYLDANLPHPLKLSKPVVRTGILGIDDLDGPSDQSPRISEAITYWKGASFGNFISSPLNLASEGLKFLEFENTVRDCLREFARGSKENDQIGQ